jgi:urease accessory protein
MPTDGVQREPPGSSLAQLRLMQLISPALPIGGFTYSQGLEYAVEAGWVSDVPSLQDWLRGLVEDGVACLEIPILVRLYHACVSRDMDAIDSWGRFLLAARETRELRLEEQQRARALTRLLADLDIPEARHWQPVLQHCQAAPYTLAAVHWGIPLGDAALGYAWNWLENQVAAAIKLVPLGQTDGQRVQLALAESLPRAVRRGLALEDDRIGASAPAMALASSLHETQYTRLFRS